jgi:hypothetical protein
MPIRGYRGALTAPKKTSAALVLCGRAWTNAAANPPGSATSLDQRMVSQNVRLQSQCPVYIPAFGLGDRQAIERFALPA